MVIVRIILSILVIPGSIGLVKGETFSLALVPGWNLISAPFEPQPNGITAVLSSIDNKYSAVYAFNASGRKYEGFIPGAQDNDISTIQSGRGYWLYALTAANLTFEGSSNSSEISLIEGWNLIGYKGLTSMSVTSALGSVQSSVDAVYGFNSTAGSYNAYIPGQDSNLNMLEPGHGYWIYATRNTTWRLPPTNPTPSNPPSPNPPKGLVFPGREWVTASPDSQGFDAAKLSSGIDGINNGGNVMVIRNGYVVKTRGNIGQTGINIFSAAKSITSLVFARLLQQGKVRYDDTLPGSDFPRAPVATFRQFLTMTSDYGLTPHEPGRHYAYNNEAIKFYGEYMRKTFFAGKDAPGVYQAALFDIIGHQDNITIHPDKGVKGTPWAGGPIISTRDFARAGLLVLAEGNWQGKQLIPVEYCRELYKNQIPENATMSKSPGVGESGTNTNYNQQGPSQGMKGRYSFGWWNNSNRRSANDVAYTNASGRGGNYLIVIPAWNVVIAVTNNKPEDRPSAESYINAVRSALCLTCTP
jgi:CubicO group peptidase (beta-lactamase class C family)